MATPVILKHAVADARRADWGRFEGAGALRCTAGVAIPLFAGLLLDQPAISAFGAVGAVSVGFGSFQGAYRSRAAVMIAASIAMGLAVLAGSLAGAGAFATIVVATLFAFAGSIVVALGPSAAFVGLQAVVAVLIASGYPAPPREALLRGAIVIAGGLAQTLLVALLWPLRRFAAERAAAADTYRSLAAYAAAIPHAAATAPEPHTFAATRSPLADPQPFARAADVLIFQALLDEAERLRASLAAVVTRRQDFGADPTCVASFFGACAAALEEIAAALSDARDPADAGIWAALDDCAGQLPRRVLVEALLGQLRAAWRMAGLLNAAPRPARPGERLPPLRQRPPLREAWTTLRANLTLRSSACRHALRVTAAVGVACAAYRVLELPRGYWIPMTALLVLKPEFQDTFSRGLARIAGTITGAAVATAIAELAAPGHGALTLLVLAFVWCCYAVFRINYAIFAVCLTAYVVFILMLSGVGELTAATLRAEYTLAGGLFALVLFAVWPTWAALTARDALAAMLDAHRAYVGALLDGYADPSRVDLGRLGTLRAAGRLARSNAEAVIERMVAEPARRAALPRRTALGILAALRRNALAALALHAGLERGVAAGVPGMDALRDQIVTALESLATATRGNTPPALPDLRAAQLALGATDALVNAETDLMVDSLNTVASLLSGASS